MTKKTATSRDDGWRIPDELWERILPLLPKPKPHPLGCHRRPLDPRVAMNAILLVLRTGMHWEALTVTGFCNGKTAHGWFQKWRAAGVFQQVWNNLLQEYDDQIGIDWSWLSLDGSMVKSPLGGKKDGPQPYRPREKGRQARPAR